MTEKKHKTFEKTKKNTEKHGPSQRPTLKKQIIGNVFRIVGFQWIPGRGLAAMMGQMKGISVSKNHSYMTHESKIQQSMYLLHINNLYMYMCRWIIPTAFNIEKGNNHSTEAARLWCAFPSFAPWMPWMCWMCWLMLSMSSIARFDLCIQEPWASALRALDSGTG
jgi:hypothetical protein